VTCSEKDAGLRDQLRLLAEAVRRSSETVATKTSPEVRKWVGSAAGKGILAKVDIAATGTPVENIISATTQAAEHAPYAAQYLANKARAALAKSKSSGALDTMKKRIVPSSTTSLRSGRPS
jgi:hypothetical protein